MEQVSVNPTYKNKGMPLKKKFKMHTEEIEVIVVEMPAKNEAELQKVRAEGISEFAEKFGDRYKIRMKLDKTLWNYITEIKLVLPILDKIKFSELYMNLMKVLGYIFYISIFILLFQIII
jgi:Holliday junction resolvase